jgi:hypothetical protein
VEWVVALNPHLVTKWNNLSHLRVLHLGNIWSVPERCYRAVARFPRLETLQCALLPQDCCSKFEDRITTLQADQIPTRRLERVRAIVPDFYSEFDAASLDPMHVPNLCEVSLRRESLNPDDLPSPDFWRNLQGIVCGYLLGDSVFPRLTHLALTLSGSDIDSKRVPALVSLILWEVDDVKIRQCAGVFPNVATLTLFGVRNGMGLQSEHLANVKTLFPRLQRLVCAERLRGSWEELGPFSFSVSFIANPKHGELPASLFPLGPAHEPPAPVMPMYHPHL